VTMGGGGGRPDGRGYYLGDRAAHETLFGLLSSGERIAVALVLDRYDLLQCAWSTMAESIHRLGPEWTEAALRVQRNGW
jgi:hypothetical protein